ncbi:MAG: uracil-DNA glycosylase family protein [Planctomycetota bacterium]
MSVALDDLLRAIRECRLCAQHLAHEPRPVVVADPRARILIAGQAPGTRVHATGIAWNDPSGENLRDWLGVTREQFYDPASFALVPMGFCYPGKGASGDLPPRRECSETWHQSLLPTLHAIELRVVIGQYSMRHHLGDRWKGAVTTTVRAFAEFLPTLIPLPHPSPRNRLWMRKNPWFADELLPQLRDRVRGILLRSSC